MRNEVVVVDYGSGNIRSLANALRRSVTPDQTVTVTQDPAAVAAAERLVLPGVGAFAECVRKLGASGMLPALEAAVLKEGRPLLGICVGMQILAEEGLEFGRTPGLGWVRGQVRQIRLEESNAPRKLPHIGWTPVEATDSPLFGGIPPASYFYFVHSFVLVGTDASTVALANYGESFSAAIQSANIFGCQFHPEKSDQAGLRLLENFCRWKP